jgi:hypothetical protein
MNQLYTRTRAWLLAGLLLGVSLRAAAQNTWTQKADFGGSGRYGAVAFSIGNKGYLGTGYLDYSTPTNDFWEYDQAANTWTQKASFSGGARGNAVGFSIGSKGYVGTGATSSLGNGGTNDFWEYDPAANAWVRKANFGGGIRSGAVGFSLGSKGYVGTGTNDGNNYTKDFWEYDPATDSWTRKNDFGGSARFYATGFGLGSKGYLGTGADANFNFTKDFWEYDPTANAWTQKADFGGSARDLAASFSIGTKGYLGTGYGDGFSFFNDFWEYDPTANAWVRKANFGGGARCWDAGFAIGTKGYIGTGYKGDYTFGNDLWEYTPVPSCQAPTNVAVASVTTTTASVSFAGSSLASGGYTVSYTASGSPKAQTVAGSASPVALTGLAPNTTYTVTVTSNCAGTQTATSTPAVSFTTLCEKPVLTAPASQTVPADAGQCGASVAFAGSATGTPAPTIAYTLPGGQAISSPYVFPVGTTTVTATATNSCGDTDAKSFTVTVQDRQAPTVRTQPVTVALANGTATITAAQVNNGSSDNCSGALTYSLSKSTFSCANIGPNAVMLTVTDASGNQASGPATVTVTGSIPAPTISVTPANTTYTGGVPTTLYLGYGPQSATLTASGAGQGGTYQWSPGAGLSTTTGSSTEFTASTAGTFTYTVTATSASGCSATTSVTLTVVDARCSSNGKKLDKVLVCHNGNTLCIGSDGVADHLAHGDPLGNCPASATAQPASLARTSASPTGSEASTSLEAYPNPFSSSTVLRFRAAQAGAAQVQVYNGLGQLVATLYSGPLQAGELVERTLSSTGLSAGLYTCRYVAPGGEHLTQRVVLAK